jgi:hypothetical protein
MSFIELWSGTIESYAVAGHPRKSHSDRTESYLKQNDIDYIDMVPLLRGCFVKGQQPYFRDADGHLNAVGQHEVAQAVNTYLKEKQKTKAQY